MKIYLATWILEASQGISLTKKGVKKRLMSYYHSKDKPDEFSHYTKTGVNKNEDIPCWKRSYAKRPKKEII